MGVFCLAWHATSHSCCQEVKKLLTYSGLEERSAAAPQTRTRGVVGLTRLPVTEEIAGSNPVGSAKKNAPHVWGFFLGQNSVL